MIQHQVSGTQCHMFQSWRANTKLQRTFPPKHLGG